MLDGYDLSSGVIFNNLESYRIDETYPWHGVHRTAVNRCNGVKVSLTHDLSQTAYVLEIRAFNDGVAYRHVIAGAANVVRVPNEYSVFILPAGTTDYTTMILTDRRCDSSWAHQIACRATFHSPILTMAAHPQSVLDNPAVDVIKSIQAVWDETIVLPESRIGELSIFARRSGDMWILAVMNARTGPDHSGTAVISGGGAIQGVPRS